MAANVAVTYNFTAGTPAVADNVDQNFTDLTSWINTNAVHLDGSKAFTGIPSGPATDPTTANQLTRKAYVDAAIDVRCGGGWQRGGSAQTFASGGATTKAVWDTELSDSDGFWTAGDITVPAGKGGIYVVAVDFFNVLGVATNNSNFSGKVIAGAYGATLGSVGGAGGAASACLVCPLTAGQTVYTQLTIAGGVAATANVTLNLFRVSA